MKPAAGRRRGPVFVVLLGALGGIWGYVFYQLAAGMADEVPDGGAGSARAVDPSPSPARPALRPVYAADFRDPFAWPHETVAGPPEGATGEIAGMAAAAAVPGPTLVLRGVVGTTALLHGPGDAVYFAAAGETVAGVRIVAVEVDRVVTEVEGQTYTLLLPE